MVLPSGVLGGLGGSPCRVARWVGGPCGAGWVVTTSSLSGGAGQMGGPGGDGLLSCGCVGW